jgi:hypothetical protein
MAETAEDRIRRMKAEREGKPGGPPPPRTLSYNEDGSVTDLSAPKPAPAPWSPSTSGDSDRMYALVGGTNAGAMGRLHPAIPLPSGVGIDEYTAGDMAANPAGRNLYPNTSGDPKRAPNYSPRPAARPAAPPPAAQPAPPRAAPNAPAPRQAPARQAARPDDPRERTRQDMHVIGKDGLYTKLVDAADAAGMPDPLAWAGEQLRIIVANDPNSKAHPLAVEALQNTPAARWAVPGGGRFAGGVEGQKPANRVMPAAVAGTETPLAMVPNPTIGMKTPARGPQRPVEPGLPPAPAAGNGRPGRIPPPPPKGPAPRVDPRKPPVPGFERFATRDGAHAFDGQIHSYDPETGTVKIQTATGHKVSIEYTYLDDDSKKKFEGRVAEHNEKVDFEDEKEDFAKKHGVGAYENRFAPEMAFPEHRGPDGMGGARLAARRGKDRDAARQSAVDAHNIAMGVNPEPAPVADIPPAAKAAAEDVALLAAFAAKDAEAKAPPPAEPAHLAAGRRNVADRAAADAAGEAALAEHLESGAKGPPPQEAADMMDRKFKAAAAKYRLHEAKYRARNIDLDTFAQQMGVDTGMVSPEVYEAGQNMIHSVTEHNNRQRETANRHRESNMHPAAMAASARKVIDDPNSTPQQRAHAYTMMGQPAMAQAELAAHATVESARHKAEAEANASGGRAPAEEKEPDPLAVTVHDAVDSLPPGSSFDTMVAAAQHALEAQGMGEVDAKDRVRSVLGDRAWSRLASGSVSSGSAEAFFFWKMVIGKQQEVEAATAAGKPAPPPLSEREFIDLARQHGIKDRAYAAKWYHRFRGTRPPAAGGVGSDDSAAVE